MIKLYVSVPDSHRVGYNTSKGQLSKVALSSIAMSYLNCQLSL
jgi:hypothetical protein